MQSCSFDLHSHSCLSPCGENSSTPAVMAGMFALSGFDIAALTDHNSCANCGAFLKACEHYGILGIPGMELNTREEVHVVCLFETLEGAMEFSAHVYEKLPPIKNRPHIFGEQLYADETDAVLGEEGKLLISAADIGIYDVPKLVGSFGGFAYPAHIDRSSNSLISNLGMWDPGMGFTMAELSFACPEGFKLSVGLADLKTVFGSDAHRMEQIPLQPRQKAQLPELTRKALLEWLRSDSKAEFL